MKITIQDMHRCGFCAVGVERFFTRHGLDYNDFLQNGISAERLLATKSVLADKCVRKAKQAQRGTTK